MKIEKVPADIIVIVRVLLFDSTATPEASWISAEKEPVVWVDCGLVIPLMLTVPIVVMVVLMLISTICWLVL